MTRLLRIVTMTAIWVVLWSELSVANVIGGVAVATVIALYFDTWRDGALVIRPWRAAVFLGFFAYKLVESTLVVARTVLAPRHRVRTGIIAVPLRGCSDAVATIVADSITLTPGTLTLEVQRDPLVLYVHALDTRDVDAVARDVRRLEVLAVRAFGDDDALAGLAVDDTEAWRSR